MPDRSRNVQTFANLCNRIAGDHARRDGESEPDYLLRIRRLAERVQHEQRKAKRKRARDARKRNR